MIDPIINAVEQEHMLKRDEKDFDEFGPGDTVKVFVKIKEGEKFRVQPFEGTVLAIKNGGIRKTFTVRKICDGNITVERIFPFHSPLIEKVKRTRKGKVRRAKLYYLRERIGKAARIKEKITARKK